MTWPDRNSRNPDLRPPRIARKAESVLDMHSLMNALKIPRNLFHSAAVLSLLVGLAACGGDAKESAREHYDRAVELEREGQLRASGIELKNALQGDPDLIKARLLLGEVTFRLGDVLSAEKELEKARELGASQKDWGPALALVWLKQAEYQKVLDGLPVEVTMPADQRATFYALRGHAYRGLDQLDEAKASFENALKLDGSEIRALIGMAGLDTQDYNYAQAEQRLNRVFELEPDQEDALGAMGALKLRMEDYAAAEDVFTRLQQATPENPALRISLSRAQMFNHNFTGAITTIRPLLKNNPQHPGANYIMSMAAYEIEDYETAFTHSQTVLGKAPNYLPSMLVAGASSYALGQYEQAYRHLASYIAYVPDDENARKLMGASLLKLGRPGEAATTLSPLSESEDAQTLALISNTAIYNHDLQGGLEAMQRAVKASPNNARMRMDLGLLHIAHGQTDLGVAEMEEAFALDPSEETASAVDATVKKAIRQSLRNGQGEQALELATKVLETHPEDAEAHVLMGAALAKSGRNEESHAKYKKALELEPGRVDASMTLAYRAVADGKTAEAELYMNAALQQHPQSATLLVTMARISLSVGDKAQAEKYLNLAISAEPKSPQPRMMMSVLLLERDANNVALNLLDEIGREQGDNIDFLNALGRAQLANELGGKASLTYEKLIKMRPDEGHLRYMKAQASALLENREEMRRNLEKAVELAPDHAFARYALVQLHLSENEPTAARPHADHLASHHPDDPRFIALQSKIALLDGEPTMAIRIATLGLEQDTSNPELLRILADAQLRLQRMNAAAQTYERLIELQPNNAELKFLLGRVLTGLGDTGLAKAQLHEALALNPNMHEAKLALTRIALNEQDRPTAFRLTRELAQARPDNPEVLELAGDIAMMDDDLIEARNNYTKANRRLSTPRLVEKLADIQWTTGQRTEAMRTLKVWTDENPSDHVRLLKLAEFYRGESRESAAKEVLDQVAAEAASNWSVVNDLAWQYYLLGDIEEALPFAQHANVLAPNNPAVMDTLGMILLQLGEKQQAYSFIQQAAQAAPQDLQITFHFAQALVEIGEEDEARAVLTKMLASSMQFADRSEAELLLTKLPE